MRKGFNTFITNQFTQRDRKSAATHESEGNQSRGRKEVRGKSSPQPSEILDLPQSFLAKSIPSLLAQRQPSSALVPKTIRLTQFKGRWENTGEKHSKMLFPVGFLVVRWGSRSATRKSGRGQREHGLDKRLKRLKVSALLI